MEAKTAQNVLDHGASNYYAQLKTDDVIDLQQTALSESANVNAIMAIHIFSQTYR